MFIISSYFVYGLLGWNIFISFTDWEGIIPSYNFVGFENYVNALQDPLFWQSFWNTLILFLMIPCSLGLGFFLATLLNQNVKGARVFLIIYLIPFALSFVVTGVVWNWIYRPVGGALNTTLESVGLGLFAGGWHTDPNTVMLSILIATVWQFTGYCTLILYAGLKSIPRKTIDAIKSKGASTLRVYREAVLPRLKIHILTSVVVLMIFSLRTFDLIWVLTGGGPGTTSYILPIYVFIEFQKFHLASAAAVGNILVVMVSCIVIPYLYWSFRRR
jgi:glucose/mannose transport system permease protein